MKAEIITIGDEILIGQIVDTNSAWLAERLNAIGVRVAQISSIQDDRGHIIDALNEAKERADIILITGGLGPTKDDITKETLGDYFQSNFVFNEDVYANIERIFKPRDIPVLSVNKEQAKVPDNCEVMINKLGTAPAMWFEKDGKVFVSMPGIPFEMKGLILDSIIPKIKDKYNTQAIFHKTVLTQGIGEAKLAEKIEVWRKSLTLYDIKLAFLPSLNSVRLRLSSYGGARAEQKVVEDKVAELKELIPDFVFGYDNQTLEEVVGKELNKKKQTVSTAESCTGGNIAGRLTKISGSSDYFIGSVVSYSDEVKKVMLDVSADDIEKHGAVSREVVEQMAIGVKNKLKTDYSVATSGIAGPKGGTDKKPVGTMWVAVASPTEVVSKMFRFGDERSRNVERTVITALNLLRKQIIKEEL
ncbi:MAG: competence/damage-inducible protein A [Flavobacteriales bacterium]|jgi:nicotinamide-nucleotide amidase|nr:competence/damage-inducible protein A [Flavobacteriales bacterium]